MKKRISFVVLAMFGLVMGMLAVAHPARAAVGFTVSGGRLLDANGNQFIMRGVSHPHTWFASQTTNALAGIKSLGANTVRVVLSSGDQWTENSATDVANVISQCRANRLICVLEVHDTTGFGEQSAAVSLSRAVDYWIDIQSALTGQERYVIVNIGNEPYGNQNVAGWTADTSNAIRRLRTAGFQHTIMVDGPNWGQDWTFTMRDNATSVFNADAARNTVFSVHMYGVFDTAAEITDYLGRFRTAGLPIVVGEFGHNHSDGNPDEDTIMSYTQANGIGYIGWSWSGNGGGVEYLDMVTNFNTGQLTSWGQRIFNGANGIRTTAREASVFGGAQPTTGPPTTAPPTTTPPTTTPPTSGPTSGPAGPCRVTYTVSPWNTGLTAAITIANTGGSTVNGWTLGFTLPGGQNITSGWNATYSPTSGAVSATNVSYNSSIGPNGSVGIGFQATHTGNSGRPASFTLNGTACSIA